MSSLMRKKYKGNILLAMLISLMVLTMGISVYAGYVRDKHSTNLYIDRMNGRSEINSYTTMSRNFLYSYFANKEVELMYQQTVTEHADGSQTIKRTLKTDPYYIDLADISLSEYKGEPKYLLRADEILNFAGYKFNMQVYLDMPVDEVEERLRVFHNCLAYNPDFMDDINDYIKSEDAYTIHIGDIPLIIVYEYDSWVQETKIVVSGLRFIREYFPILYYDLDGSLQGNVPEGEESTATGVVNGHIITNYIVFETIESQRERR